MSFRKKDAIIIADYIKYSFFISKNQSLPAYETLQK